ncbi:MAG TPA: lipase family protein [Terriglobales bacterium]|nr:lipase family protein [Terriglobales bacterium]
MLPINWNTAIQYALLVKIAESVNPTGAYGPNEISAIKTAGYTFLQTLYGDDLATDIDAHLGDVVTFGFLAVSDTKELVAAIRGTDTILEWLHDASYLMMPSPVAGSHGFTEDGFTAVYRSLRVGPANGTQSAKDSIKSYTDSGAAVNVTVCGHSLGGALATLLTLDVGLNTSCHAPTAYTYASPRTGDHTFAGEFNTAIPSCYRIANRQDLVPKLPPILPLPYEHVNTLCELNPPPNAINPSIPCMHHLTTYLWLMSQLAGSNANPLDADCVAVGTVHI